MAWGSIAVSQAYLTLSDVLGRMDLQLNEGRGRGSEQDGAVRLEAV